MNADPDPRSLYRPLKPNQIRLLRLQSDEDDSELGTLKIADLDDAPPYYALSHSWTDQHSYTDARIGGSHLTLGIGLLACVRRLSQLLRTGTELDPPVRYIWIDSICIKQSDLAERSSQVTLMGRLYRNAVRTLIWLGDDNNDYAGAWGLLDQIYEVFQHQNPTASHPSDIPIRMFLQSAHDAAGLPSWDDDRWTHLARLVEQRWFSRIWVVQEVALSTRDPLFIHRQSHHRHFYPWSRFGWAVAWLRNNGYLRLPRISGNLRNVDTMANLQRTEQPWPLDALISITQVKFNATDQRDKIYGLMGLASDSQQSYDDQSDELLQPDYGVEVEDLYPKVARLLLQRSRSLAFLTRAHGVGGSLTRIQREFELDLPSWCPDWSDFKVPNQGISSSLSWVHRDDTTQPTRLGFLSHFSASSGFALDPELAKLRGDGDPRVLFLRGIHVTEIRHSIPFAVNPSRDTGPGGPFTAQMTNILSKALALLRKDGLDAWAEQFVRVTTVEQHHLEGRDWEQSLRDGMAYIHELLAEDETLLSQSVQNSGDDTILAHLRDLSAGGNADYYRSLVRNYGFDRAFLITLDGRMGIGPSNAQQGDTIAVLAGGHVPYCVRRQGHHWLFVGETCVGGLMRGEALKSVQQGLLAQEVLCFR